MRFAAGESKTAIIVADTSVFINFLRIDRIDLIAGHSHDFLATDHVTAEISDRYPDQRKRFVAALDAGVILETRVSKPEELRLFGSLFASGRLGAGECSAIALAAHRGHILAIDDRVATRRAHEADETLRILATQDLMVSMIREGLLEVGQADRIKRDWASRHRFRLKLDSFRDVIG